MGLSVLAALVLLVLAYLAQSPRLLKRLGLLGHRLDLRGRMFTGYALAALLLSLGFFLAGVPLGTAAPPEPEVAEVVPTPTVAIVDNGGAMSQLENDGPTAMPLPTREVDNSAETATPALPSSSESSATLPDIDTTPDPDATLDPDAIEEPTPDESDEAAEAETSEEATAEPTSTPELDQNEETTAAIGSAEDAEAETPTPAATPTEAPTVTPTPTITPTPILEETAIINTGSSTVWMRRAPGGQNLVLMNGGDIVILLSGHANMGGALWREVSTVDGTVAWIEETYLDEPTDE